MYLRSISIYFIFNVLSALLPIVTLPILTKYLSPADYGVLAIFNIVTMFSANIFRVELNVALKRQYAENRKIFLKYLGTAFVFSNMTLLLYGLAIVLFLPFVGNIYDIEPHWMILILLLSYCRFHTVNLHHLFQLTNRALLFSIWGFAATFVTFGVCIGLLIFSDYDWHARAWAEVVVALVSLPIALYFLRKDFLLTWQFDFSILKKMLRFSSPLLVTSMLAYFVVTSDRMFLAKLSGAEELGLYTVAVQLSSAAGIFFGAILPVWESWIFAKQGGVNRQNVVKIMNHLLVIVTLSIVVMLLLPKLLGWVLPYLAGRNFSGVEAYLTSTTISVSCGGIFGLISPILIFMRKTAVVAYVNIAMAVLNCICLYFFIEFWGSIGAAYALAFTFIFGSCLMLFFIIKFTNISIGELIKKSVSRSL